jgi:hypothetical protein
MRSRVAMSAIRTVALDAIEQPRIFVIGSDHGFPRNVDRLMRGRGSVFPRLFTALESSAIARDAVVIPPKRAIVSS